MAWSEWVSLGLHEPLFWECTLPEVRVVFGRADRHRRWADLRAGLIAATIVNMAGKHSRRNVKPQDFFARSDDRAHDTPENLRNALIGLGVRTGAVLA